MKEVSRCLYIAVRPPSFVSFTTKEVTNMKALNDDLLITKIQKVQRKIDNACGVFYARFLMENPEKEMIYRANSLLIPKKYPLPEPQGEREAEALSKRSIRKKELLKAQIYDIIEEFAQTYRASENSGPQPTVDKLNELLNQFVQDTADEMFNKIQANFLRGDPMGLLSKSLSDLFEKNARKVDSRAEFYRKQIESYQTALSHAQAGCYYFSFEVDKTDGTCEACSSKQGEVYTLEEIVAKDLLPPFHPNCRCKLVPADPEWEKSNVSLTGIFAKTADLFSIQNAIALLKDPKAFIPQQIDNDVALKVFDWMSKMTNNISEEKIKGHAINTEVVLNSIEYDILNKDTSYIENQAEWRAVDFGSGEHEVENDEGKKTKIYSNVADSGCEIIATYNALFALGEQVDGMLMVNLISHFERDGAVLNGDFGVSPLAVYRYFVDRGYDVVMTARRDANIINDLGDKSDTVIVTVYNNQNDITDMVHTVSVTKREDGKYEVHNTNFKNENGQYAVRDNNGLGYDTVQDAIDDSSQDPAVLCVIGIRKPDPK